MSQDDQNRQDQQDDDRQVGTPGSDDQSERESRGRSDAPPSRTPGGPSDVEDTDEMEEDREDDQREDGPNRRNNIG